jgi:hypothetical protein
MLASVYTNATRRFCIKALSLALLASTGLAPNAHTQDRLSIVGSWHGELPVSEARAGQAVDLRRWLSTFRPDGTYTIVFRYYLNDCLQAELTESGVWGLNGQVQWTQCRSVKHNSAPPERCWYRQEYVIQRIDEREMAYIGMASGQSYLETRVSSDFRLPGTCTS